jgi:hypothetical protein
MVHLVPPISFSSRKNPATLEEQIKNVTDQAAFHRWTEEVAPLLEQSSKRELYEIVNSK